MDIHELVRLFIKVTWAVLPVVIASAIIQYRRFSGYKEILDIISIKTNSYVYWVDEAYPTLPKEEKIDLIEKTILDELKFMGFRMDTRKECLDKEIKAAFKKKEMMYNPFTLESDDEIETVDRKHL